MTNTLYDPLFGKIEETAAFKNLVTSPLSGKPLKKLYIGCHDVEPFMALVNQEDKVVFPLITY